MTRSIGLVFLLLISLIASGQVASQSDSIREQGASDFSTRIESANRKIDSVQLRANNFLSPDLSIQNVGQKVLDRQRRRFDSLDAVREIDSVKTKLSAEVDSLRQLGQPVQHVLSKLDSVKEIGIPNYLDKVESGRQQLQSGLTSPQGRIEGAVNEKLDLFNSQGGKLGNIDLKDVGIDVPELDLANSLRLSEIPGTSQRFGVSAIKDKVETQIDLPDSPIADLNTNGTVEKIRDGTQGLNDMTDKFQGYGTDAAKIAEGDIGDLEQIPQAIEGQVTKLEDVQQWQAQTGQVDQHENIIKDASDPEAVKELAKDYAIEVAAAELNHFEGKTELLRSTMEKMRKAKSRYKDVATLDDLAKRPPNPHKGKQLMERLLPGLTFQIQKSNTVLIDLNPLATYLLTKRFSIGAGWNERLSFVEWNQIVSADRIYGPRVNGNFLFKDGLSVKAELECMNTYVPQSTKVTDGKREWIGGVFVGLKKDFRFMGMVKGNVQMLYNLWDAHGASPYADRFNIRSGFELAWKKKRPTPRFN
jgi:hypothetical protein